jgi:hypothetical protein
MATFVKAIGSQDETLKHSSWHDVSCLHARRLRVFPKRANNPFSRKTKQAREKEGKKSNNRGTWRPSKKVVWLGEMGGVVNYRLVLKPLFLLLSFQHIQANVP